MTRYHITPDGEIKPCRAKSPATCKYKSAHFDSIAKAERFLELEWEFEQKFPKYHCDDKRIDEIYQKEPEITSILTNLQKKDSRFTLSGLEFRLKSRESIREKIEVRQRYKNVDELYDIVRYTAVVKTEDYRKEQREIFKGLLENNVDIVGVKDSWDIPGYKGVNCKLKKDGVKFELQIHTPESLEAKEKAHVLYEQQRLLNERDPVAIELSEKMRKIFDAVPKVD